MTIPTIGSAFAALERLGIVRELTGRRRDRLFGYAKYLEILDEGTRDGLAGPA